MTATGQTPFIYACDWNSTVDEVMNTGWPEQLQAELVTPHNVSASCVQEQGAAGSMIDYVLVSQSLVPYVKVEAMVGVPRAPHMGLIITIKRG